MTKPVFVHDCDTCTFLGTYHGQDLYVHGTPENPSSGGSIIARYGSEGWEYSSGWVFGVKRENPHPELAEAARRYLAHKYGGPDGAIT